MVGLRENGGVFDMYMSTVSCLDLAYLFFTPPYTIESIRRFSPLIKVDLIFNDLCSMCDVMDCDGSRVGSLCYLLTTGV